MNGMSVRHFLWIATIYIFVTIVFLLLLFLFYFVWRKQTIIFTFYWTIGLSRPLTDAYNYMYNRLSLARPLLSWVYAYLEVKIRFLFKQENLTKVTKFFSKEEKLFLRTNSPLFRKSFNISLTSGVNLKIRLLNVVVRFIVFLSSANLIGRYTDISQCFRESLTPRENESRLYILHRCW